jgi:hypothetical protein
MSGCDSEHTMLILAVAGHDCRARRTLPASRTGTPLVDGPEISRPSAVAARVPCPTRFFVEIGRPCDYLRTFVDITVSVRELYLKIR